MSNLPVDEKIPGPLVAALVGGAVGLVVMFFPPHGITLFLAPFAGGIVAGMRGRAEVTKALIMSGVVASLITGIAVAAVGVMLWVSGDDKNGMAAEISKMTDDAGPLALLAGVALWGYAAVASFFGALFGGYLKRMG